MVDLHEIGAISKITMRKFDDVVGINNLHFFDRQA